MQTRRIVASLPGDISYDIRIGIGGAHRLGTDLQTYERTAKATQAIIVTDSNVGPLYAKQLAATLREAAYTTHTLTIPAGETSKSIEVASELWQALTQLGCSRDTIIVALGGGVVGDIAGFVAATYLRGVPLVQVPTSLLAMIDACVGGKTALNLGQGKNLVGVFKQPDYVCADLELLASLPSNQWTSGLAELAKMAVIDSDDFFFWLSDRASELTFDSRALANAPDVLTEAITRALTAKLAYVVADEFDSKGIHAQLNYGHTLGHALEQCSGYTLAHGHAVAEGMRFAARLAVAVCGASLEMVKAQDELLDTLAIPRVTLTPAVSELLACMHLDKKAAAGTIRIVLPTDIGCCALYEVDDTTLSSHLASWAASRKA